MHNFLITAALLFIPFWGMTHTKTADSETETKPETTTQTPTTETKSESQSLYSEMHLEGKVNAEAFENALEGYNKITDRKRDVLTLIDFSKPSNQKRLFVFDMKNKRMLFSSVVAHGQNSGGLMATDFSNQNGSHKSSLGFYLTQNTYQGSNGYSLVLEGLEKGINDNARRRAIVMHGANYANPNVVAKGGRLGRSFGCPALPHSINRPVIDAIKDGSVLYIYADSDDYMKKSSILNS